MEDSKAPPNATDLKNQGNERVSEGKYAEAILLYTHAIKLEPKNYILYSNRSYAFLKADQHFLALQDANETIQLEPQWPKGYFRRAEVEAASGLYDEAIISYGRALQLQPNDTKILSSIDNLVQLRKANITSDKNTIWISTCVGLIIGISIVVSDYTLTEKPTLTNPILMVLFAVLISGAGYGIGRVLVMTKNWSAGKTLLPPQGLDLMGNSEAQHESETRRTKYSKAQARHRYKQGKI